MNRVVICIPTRGMIYYKVADFIARQGEMGFRCLYSTSSYGTEAARRKLVGRFLQLDYDFLFFLDDDVLPPDNVIARLIHHKLDFITASYSIMERDGLWDSCSLLDGKEYQRMPFMPGHLVEVDACGMGACLIKREMIEKCRGDFGLEFDATGECVKSEDYFFCEKVRERGYRIFCDTSVRCEHYKMLPLGKGVV